MKTLFMTLELGNLVLTKEEVADFFNVNSSAVIVQNMTECIGTHRYFRNLTDIYLWTCKHWYGLYEGKLTYVRVKGIEEINVMFSLKYSDYLRFVVAADTVKIIGNAEKDLFEGATNTSRQYFNKERITKLKPLVKKIQHLYKILYCPNNPY